MSGAMKLTSWLWPLSSMPASCSSSASLNSSLSSIPRKTASALSAQLSAYVSHADSDRDHTVTCGKEGGEEEKTYGSWSRSAQKSTYSLRHARMAAS